MRRPLPGGFLAAFRVLQTETLLAQAYRYTRRRVAAACARLAHMHRYGRESTLMSVAPHILVVDDDADMRQLVSDYLGEFGLRVSCAPDGKAMRRQLADNVVDLVLLDLKLPSRTA